MLSTPHLMGACRASREHVLALATASLSCSAAGLSSLLCRLFINVLVRALVILPTLASAPPPHAQSVVLTVLRRCEGGSQANLEGWKMNLDQARLVREHDSSCPVYCNLMVTSWSEWVRRPYPSSLASEAAAASASATLSALAPSSRDLQLCLTWLTKNLRLLVVAGCCIAPGSALHLRQLWWKRLMVPLKA